MLKNTNENHTLISSWGDIGESELRVTQNRSPDDLSTLKQMNFGGVTVLNAFHRTFNHSFELGEGNGFDRLGVDLDGQGLGVNDRTGKARLK